MPPGPPASHNREDGAEDAQRAAGPDPLPRPVATLRELSILLGILIAGDRPGKRVWAGGTLCVLGAVLTVV